MQLGQGLTRKREYRHLARIFDDGGHAGKPLTWQGDISLGPPREGVPTLQRLEGNPRWRGVPDLDDAGPRAATAYVGTYGPATLDHLHYWLGEGLSAGRRRITTWFSELGDRLVAVDVEGLATAYVRREALEASVPSQGVRLLPGHDQWVTWLDEQPRPQAAITREAERLGVILGRDLRVSVSA